MNREAEAWANSMGMEIEGYVGGMAFGEAYETKCGKIIKITSDMMEYIAADKMIDERNNYTVNIYDTIVFANGNMGILQELFDTDTKYCIESLWADLATELESQGCEFKDMDPDDFPDMPEETLKMYHDLCESIREYAKYGTIAMDLKPDNLGMNSKGNWGFFDQKEKNVSSDLEFKEYQKEKILILNTEEPVFDY